MNKARIASCAETQSLKFRDFCSGLGVVRYCRQWEYPWIWFNGLQGSGGALLDVGSADSLITPYLHKFFSVTSIDIDPKFSSTCKIVEDERLPFEDGRFDWVTSFSVIEHQPNKCLAVNEVVRVLKPGGSLGITFDLFEPSFGMTWPHGFRPLDLQSFEKLIWHHPAFGNSVELAWNVEDIPAFLDWHQTTAAHHTYVAGGAVLRCQK